MRKDRTNLRLAVPQGRSTRRVRCGRFRRLNESIRREIIGTMLLVILGDGVVANVVLNRSKGQNGGWIVITTGWAFAVTIAVYAANAVSGAHLNPAVTIALATIGTFAWASVPGYVAAQMIGAFLGAIVVWLAYLPHWRLTTGSRREAGGVLHGACRARSRTEPDQRGASARRCSSSDCSSS